MPPRNLNVWGHEDGEQWFAEGAHLSLEQMIREVEKIEVECNGQDYYDEETRASVETGYVSHYLIVEDARDEERFVVFETGLRGWLAQWLLGAVPATSLQAGSGIFEDPDQLELQGWR